MNPYYIDIGIFHFMYRQTEVSFLLSKAIIKIRAELINPKIHFTWKQVLAINREGR